MFFIDTTFLLRISYEKDHWHDNAQKLIPKIKNQIVWISNIILIETLNGLSDFLNGKQLENMYQFLNENYNIYRVDKQLQDKAIKISEKYNGALGFAECIPIAIMEEIDMNEIISFNKHFDNKDGIISKGTNG